MFHRRGPSPLSVLVLLAALGLAAAPWDTAAQAAPLQRGRTVRGSLAAGDTARYSLEVRDTFFVFGEVAQISVPVTVRVLDAEGQQRGRFAGPGVGANRFALRLDKGGTYTLQVIPEEGRKGDYALTLHRVEPVAKDPARLVEQLMARYDGPESPGAAVRVWRAGRTLYSRAFGMANLAYRIPFRIDTRTNIGSTRRSTRWPCRTPRWSCVSAAWETPS